MAAGLGRGILQVQGKLKAARSLRPAARWSPASRAGPGASGWAVGAGPGLADLPRPIRPGGGSRRVCWRSGATTPPAPTRTHTRNAPPYRLARSLDARLRWNPDPNGIRGGRPAGIGAPAGSEPRRIIDSARRATCVGDGAPLSPIDGAPLRPKSPGSAGPFLLTSPWGS
jgi:hypothetical protein